MLRLCWEAFSVFSFTFAYKEKVDPTSRLPLIVSDVNIALGIFNKKAKR